MTDNKQDDAVPASITAGVDSHPAAAAAAAGEGAAAKSKTGPKRKVAMYVAYLGAGYHGMQRNPNMPTIEAELESALVKAGAISDQNAGSFQKIHWMRAARTDKGVSAVCQVVSAKLLIEPQETFAARINQHLPEQIRIMGIQRATEGFDARKFCEKRKYEYILPAWVFDPNTGRGRGAPPPVAAAAAAPPPGGSSNASEPTATMTEATEPQAETNIGNGSSMEEDPSAVAGHAAADAAAVDAAAAGGGPGDDDDEGAGADAGNGSAKLAAPLSVAAGSGAAAANGVGEAKLQRLRAEIAASQSRFEFGPEQLARLNEVLQQYQGTHNFHNYTIRCLATDSSALRYILSFTAELKEIAGQPWVKMVVVGQSFMLHQIRKMVGMVIAIMRGVAPATCLKLALDPDRDFNTPMAPELGLFLDETYYDAYNEKFSFLHGPVTFEPYRAEAEAFKEALLYPHITGSDSRELINALWLTGLTDSYYKFSHWSSWSPVRNTAAAIEAIREQRREQRQQEAEAAAAGGDGPGAEQQGRQQQGRQQQGRQQGKRKGRPGGGRGDQQQQQQQRNHKQSRLERPGKHAGASAAMVVGSQETYGMQPHSDTPKAAAARQELREMFNPPQQQQQQQQQQQHDSEAVAEELDNLYDMDE